MKLTDWRDLQFENSPFFIHGTDPATISRIYGDIEKGTLGDWAIAKALIPIVIKHKARSFTIFNRNKLNRLYGTTLQNAEMYLFGLVTPLVLIDASFTWIDSGENEASSLISKNPKIENNEFVQYLAKQLPGCYHKLLKAKNCSSIFQHARLFIFQKDLYFRVGVEASNDCFLLYARDVAKIHNAIEYGYKL